MTTTTVGQIIFNSPPSLVSKCLVSCWCDSTAERTEIHSVSLFRHGQRGTGSLSLLSLIKWLVAGGRAEVFAQSCQADEEVQGLKPDAAFSQQEAIFHKVETGNHSVILE